MRSIRGTLIIGTTLVVLATLLVGGLFLYRGVRSALVTQIDESLESKARLLASTVEVTPEGVELDFDDFDLDQSEPGAETVYLQVATNDGELLYRSDTTGDETLPTFGNDEEASAFQWVVLSGDRKTRAVGFAFRPKVEQPDEGELPQVDSYEDLQSERLSLVLAREVRAADRFLSRLRFLLLSFGLLAALACVGLLLVVIGRGLAPLSSLAKEIGRLGDRELSTRIELGSTPGEIAPVVTQLNDLLRRLEEAFERERRFSADVAHELRTPLAGLRATLEVALSRTRSGEDYRETLQDSMQITSQLQSMIENLLYLGRVEAGHLSVERTEADLITIVRQAWAPLAESAEKRHLEVAWGLPHDATVVTDPALLSVAIRNLLANAVEHSNEGGKVVIEVRAASGETALSIRNTGCEVSDAMLPQLFERFGRGDAARANTGLHCGLGLPLVESIARLLGHATDFSAEAGGEFRATLIFLSS